MLQHVAVERVQGGIVNIGDEYAFAQVIQYNDAGNTTQPAEGFLMQLSPDTCTGTERQQAYRLAAQPNVITNNRVRRYLPLSGSRTIGPVP